MNKILHGKSSPSCAGSFCDSAGGHRGKRFAKDNVGVTCKKCLKRLEQRAAREAYEALIEEGVAVVEAIEAGEY